MNCASPYAPLDGFFAFGLNPAFRFSASRRAWSPDNGAQRVLSLAKGNNVGQLPDLRYEIQQGDDGLVRVVWIDRAEMERRRMAWRTPMCNAVMVMTDKATGTVIERRVLGRGTDPAELMTLASAQPECFGPALTWGQHKRQDGTADMRTLTAGFERDDKTYAFAITGTLPIRAA